MIVVGLSVYFIYGVILRCPPSCSNVRGPRCRVLQYVHNLLIVGCQCDRSLDTDKWAIVYGSKEDLILNVMVGFYDLNDLW